jgi:hypothetical protein
MHDVWWVGRADDTGYKSFSTVTVDNVVFDLEDASFPLGVAANAQHSTSFVDGFLLAENFEVNRRPLGFNSSGSGITWSTNVTGMEASSALRIDQSSGDVWYDLCNNYSNVYTYSQVRPDGVANYRYYTKFSSPVGTYADLIGVTLNYATKPTLIGVTGGSNVSAGASVSNGITYHMWTEFESGTVARCYWSTNATKPSTPTMQGPVGGASYTNTMIRYVHLNDGGKTQHDKWRISVVGPIGSNPQ